MNATETIRTLLEREGFSSTEASLRMGMKRAYLSSILSNNRTPKVNTLAKFAEAMNYELILRSRDDGYEFIIDE